MIQNPAPIRRRGLPAALRRPACALAATAVAAVAAMPVGARAAEAAAASPASYVSATAPVPRRGDLVLLLPHDGKAALLAKGYALVDRELARQLAAPKVPTISSGIVATRCVTCLSKPVG